MTEPIAEKDFDAAEGTADWRALMWGAKAHYETGDFATGARFVAAIAEVAAESGHAPMIDLRPDTVTVQVLTIPVGLTDDDLALARRISAIARDLDLTARPEAVQDLQLVFDTKDTPSVMGFWRAALGYAPLGEDLMVQPDLIGPSVWFQDKLPKVPRNRIHVDVSVPRDQAEARVQAVLDAGGRLLGDQYAPSWWSLIDADGNVADICTYEPHEDSGAAD